MPRRGGRPARPAARRSRRGSRRSSSTTGLATATAEVAPGAGRHAWCHEPVPGYGAAVHAGLLAATARPTSRSWTATAPSTPRDLLALLDDVRSGRADLAVGRRRPVAPRRLAVARAARQRPGRLVAAPADRDARPRHRADAGVPPRRRCSTSDVRDRRFGYPVELLQKATVAGWRLSERDVGLPPARPRHAVEGVRLGARHDACGPRLLAGARVTPSVLVVAKAPEAGPGEDPARGRDRHGAGRRPRRRGAARHAGRLRPPPWAPDTATSRWPATWTAPSADPSSATALTGWTVHPQRRGDFGARLAAAHARRARPGRPGRHGHPAAHARTCCSPSAAGLDVHDAVLGPAEDGGLVGPRAARPGSGVGAS